MEDILIRRLRQTDSLEDLTALLHRAYESLAAQGLRYVATHQGVDVTAKRVSRGSCSVAERAGTIVGTVTFYDSRKTSGCDWYDKPHVASFGQFAVEPTWQHQGIGSLLIDHLERQAKDSGATELALDTAQPAAHLIRFYERRGYRLVGSTDFRPVTNYLSVVMSKSLSAPDVLSIEG